MPAILLALLILLFIGCASKPPPAEPVAECQSDEFSGSGTGANENEALAEAHSALSRQISSSVNVTIERVVSQQISNGKENLNSGYESKTVIESNLSNAHDARIVSKKRSGDKMNVTVCMTKTDAAKGFLERQRLLADSLSLASNMEQNTEHPRQKNAAWHKTQMLNNDFIRIQYLLEGWGIKSPYAANETYAKARENYNNYCKNMKVFWQDAGNECSNVVFAALSQKIKMEKSDCTGGGLNMKLSCQEKCKNSSFGVECTYDPSLSIESCGGESYSLLKTGTPATGIDISNVKAREKLADNLPKAAFLSEWEREINEWVPKCAD